MLERRFERLRSERGAKAALERYSNAAYLLGYEKEFEAKPSYRAKARLIDQAARVEAGHKLSNIFRHRKVIPPITHRSLLNHAATKILGIDSPPSQTTEQLEELVVGKLLHLSRPWDPSSLQHRNRLTAEINRCLRERGQGVKAHWKRALETGLKLRRIHGQLKGLPRWAPLGTGAGLVVGTLYAAYKLGEPDADRVILPLILLLALVRADLEGG